MDTQGANTATTEAEKDNNFEQTGQAVDFFLSLTLLPYRSSSEPAFFWRLTGGRFLGALAEDTLDTLMENTLDFMGHILALYHYTAAS